MKYNIRPGDVQGYGTVVRSDNQRLDWESQRVAMPLFGYLGELLEGKMGEMEELFEDGMQYVRMTYYPPCPQPEMVVGVTRNSDAAGITILHQVNGVEGFQIKKDGVWNLDTTQSLS
ncbi:protein srg1 [Quercus suber]|uniref:Protein srg1 n=1 Tax=Quercus suber TaxID=58331 RepID=A0AAW0LC11_QUESU